MKNEKLQIKKLKTIHIILFIVLIIILIPPLLTIPALFDFFVLSDSGQIGDAIGGITAPFINGIAAILVFIAFKEQVKANDLFIQKESERFIIDQINRIKDDKEILKKISSSISIELDNAINRKGIDVFLITLINST